MSDWPVGLSTGLFYRTSIFDCLERIRNAGFLMIEVCSFPEHLDYHDEDAVKAAARKVRELGMEVYSFHAPFSDDIDITALDHDRRKHAWDEIHTAARAAAALEARYFVIHPGPERSFEPSADERVKRLWHAADLLNGISDRCEDLGVGFVLENMLPHLLFGNVRDMMWIVSAIRAINVGTCLDTGHAYLSGDLETVLYKLSGHLQMVHANDSNGERDDHLPPGHGDIDWHALFCDLSRTGFCGGIVLELAGGGQEGGEDRLARAREGRRYLRDLSRRLDLTTPPTAVAGEQATGG